MRQTQCPNELELINAKKERGSPQTLESWFTRPFSGLFAKKKGAAFKYFFVCEQRTQTTPRAAEGENPIATAKPLLADTYAQ